MTQSAPIDLILLEVLKNAFETIADEMALIVLRTSHSSIVRDSMDFSTAICDAEGRTLAQGLTNPGHLGSFFDAMRHLLRQHHGAIYPGDIFIGNDPYAASGMHLPDVFIIRPIFRENELAAWGMTLAHQIDVGGIVPGSNSLGSTEIFQEGLRLPFVKLIERGQRNQAVWDIIGLNVRLPETLFGDLGAQISACMAGERAMLELIERYSLATIRRYADELNDYAERLTRAEFRSMPAGTYRFVDHLDGLGENPTPIEIHVAVTFKDGEAIVDWTGTAAEVKGGINATLPFTKAATYAALRAIMSVEIPTCQGFERAVRVIAPEGTLVNPRPPAACGSRAITGYRCIDCLFGALAQIVPDRVTADTTGGSTLITFAGKHEGKQFIYAETLMGVWGGTSQHDGQDGVPHMGANQSNTPVELIESEYPLRVEHYGLVTDTAGPGRFRGGNSLIREFRVLSDDVMLIVRSDKRDFPPHGLFGGGTGAPSWNIINPGPEQKIMPVTTTRPVALQKGDVFRHLMAGGGGFGDPLIREPQRVLEDVRAGRVSIAEARTAYGVVINDHAVLTIDAEATQTARELPQFSRPF
jgi:N-methylhydantoinase B